VQKILANIGGEFKSLYLGGNQSMRIHKADLTVIVSSCPMLTGLGIPFPAFVDAGREEKLCAEL
jgi:hypothetical protein